MHFQSKPELNNTSRYTRVCDGRKFFSIWGGMYNLAFIAAIILLFGLALPYSKFKIIAAKRLDILCTIPNWYGREFFPNVDSNHKLNHSQILWWRTFQHQLLFDFPLIRIFCYSLIRKKYICKVPLVLRLNTTSITIY